MSEQPVLGLDGIQPPRLTPNHGRANPIQCGAVGRETRLVGAMGQSRSFKAKARSFCEQQLNNAIEKQGQRLTWVSPAPAEHSAHSFIYSTIANWIFKQIESIYHAPHMLSGTEDLTKTDSLGPVLRSSHLARSRHRIRIC